MVGHFDNAYLRLRNADASIDRTYPMTHFAAVTTAPTQGAPFPRRRAARMCRAPRALACGAPRVLRSPVALFLVAVRTPPAALKYVALKSM